MEKREESITPFITNNEKEQRFEFLFNDGEYAFIEYRCYQKDMALMHTVVPEEKQGLGIAGQLTKYVLDYAREKDLKLIIYCPYVAAYLKKHPEYNDLVQKR